MTSNVQAPRSEGEATPSNPSEAACLEPSLSTSQINSQVALDAKNLWVMQPTSETAEWKLEDIDGDCQTANANTEPFLSVFPGQVCSPSLDTDQGLHSEHSLTMSVPSSNCKPTAATAPSLEDESGVNKTTASRSQDISEMDDCLRSISLPEVENVPAVDIVEPLDARTHPAPIDPASKHCAPTEPAPNKSEAQSRTSTGEDRMTAAFTATNTKDAGQRKPSGIPLTKAAGPRLTTPLRSTSGSVNRRGGRGVEAGAPSSASLRRVSANNTDK